MIAQEQQQLTQSDIMQYPCLIIGNKPFGDVALAFHGGPMSLEQALVSTMKAQQTILAQMFMETRIKEQQAVEEDQKARDKLDLVIARPKVRL